MVGWICLIWVSIKKAIQTQQCGEGIKLIWPSCEEFAQTRVASTEQNRAACLVFSYSSRLQARSNPTMWYDIQIQHNLSLFGHIDHPKFSPFFIDGFPKRFVLNPIHIWCILVQSERNCAIYHFLSQCPFVFMGPKFRLEKFETIYKYHREVFKQQSSFCSQETAKKNNHKYTIL